VIVPDTSILIAAFCRHEYHEVVLKALTAADKRESLFIAVPVIVET
jgi:predicted nucleic acid-binding protein